MTCELCPSRDVLSAIAIALVGRDGLRVGDLPTAIACWIADDDGDDLGDAVCRLTDGRYVYRVADRITLGGLTRRIR